MQKMNMGTVSCEALDCRPPPTPEALTTPSPSSDHLAQRAEGGPISTPSTCRYPQRSSQGRCPHPAPPSSRLLCPSSWRGVLRHTRHHTLPTSTVLPSHLSPPPILIPARLITHLLVTYYVSVTLQRALGFLPPETDLSGRRTGTGNSEQRDSPGGAVRRRPSTRHRVLPPSSLASLLTSLPWPGALPTLGRAPFPSAVWGQRERLRPGARGARGLGGRAGLGAPQAPAPSLRPSPGRAEAAQEERGRALVHPSHRPSPPKMQRDSEGGDREINTFDFLAKVNGNCHPEGDLGTGLPALAIPGAGGAGTGASLAGGPGHPRGRPATPLATPLR
nr:translation initiation factor IF-2-like [Pongo abelii]